MTVRKIKVLMVTDSLEVGGAEQVAVDVANSLDRDVHEVSFCATRQDGLLRNGLADDVDVWILGRRATWDIPKMVEFGSTTRRMGIDVIHSHGRGTMRFVSLARALGLVDARHLFHDHFGRLHLDRSAGTSLRVPLTHGIDAYVGVESRLCRWAIETVGLPPDRVFLVRSGVQLDRFARAEATDLRSTFDLGDCEVAMVMVANFRPQKDHPTLFRALAELPRSQQNRLKVVICGSTTADPAYFRGCQAMLTRLGVDDLVVPVGVRDDTPSLLAGADAAVFSSKNESGPLVLLEYMASGLPFVATETGEIAHAVRDSGVGILVEPRDYLALADALSDLLDMTPQERTSMGARGHDLVVEKFGQVSAAHEVEQIYRRLLGLGGKAPTFVEVATGPPPRTGRRSEPEVDRRSVDAPPRETAVGASGAIPPDAVDSMPPPTTTEDDQ